MLSTHVPHLPSEAASRVASPAPLVSIGVPVYNGSRFLRQALDSLLAQTLTNFELIISDNASSDDTPSICCEYAQRDPRVRHFRQPKNLGAPRNWNFVAEMARGRYFKWATANDECAPTMLERCVAVLEADPKAVLCQGTTCLVDEESGTREPYTRDLALLESRADERLASLCLKLALNNGQSGVIRLAALRRTRLDRLYIGGDFPLMAELAMQGKFIVLSDVLLFRRMGPGTFSRSLSGEEERQFYDPLSGKALLSNRARLHLDLLRSVLTARLPMGDRLRALGVTFRRIRWAYSGRRPWRKPERVA